MFGVFGPLFILPKGKQHGSFSISLFTQLYGLNLIILTIVIDISDFVTKDASFLSGLLTGIVLVFCTVAFSISYKLSKRIENRIRMNKK